jgi:hypothetical protein
MTSSKNSCIRGDGHALDYRKPSGGVHRVVRARASVPPTGGARMLRAGGLAIGRAAGGALRRGPAARGSAPGGFACGAAAGGPGVGVRRPAGGPRRGRPAPRRVGRLGGGAAEGEQGDVVTVHDLLRTHVAQLRLEVLGRHPLQDMWPCQCGIDTIHTM